MYKLRINISQPANYVYHMLSVSKVGYDNSYGEKYHSFHEKRDLEILKEYENELTVEGGEHCGALYTLLVTKPAAASSIGSLKRYYEAILDLFDQKDYLRTTELFKDLSDEFLDKGSDSYEEVYSMILGMFSDYSSQIVRIAEVMLKNIEVHEQKVWDQEKQVLETFIEKFEEALLKQDDLVLKWEAELKTDLLVENFEIVFVTSIEDGAQAIDISETKDVFNVHDDVSTLMRFISHEIGIYIILQSIPQSMKEQMQKYWLCIESLATYHNKRVLLESENLFIKDNQYIGKFDEIYDSGRCKNIVEIIETAVG